MQAFSARGKVLKGGKPLKRLSYKRLWKLLIDKELDKKTLSEISGVSSSTLTKLAKNKSVNTDILIKICTALDCDLPDITELVDD